MLFSSSAIVLTLLSVYEKKRKYKQTTKTGDYRNLQKYGKLEGISLPTHNLPLFLSHNPLILGD